ncbi:MAG: DNA polymerase III subunit gamma/tau, partial [Armatimonadota bacterium]
AADRLSHAYLFCGPRGTGKTTTARILAKAINCERGPTPTPCGECPVCVSIREGNALDIVEIDAASNRGIDEIRELRERVRYSPARCRAKVYFLDEVHMLTKEAFNALLKTLEEPPPHTFFVLVTTEPHKLPATIISRCQRFDFRPISTPEIAEALQRVASEEEIKIDAAAVESIARAARGALRDAESILDQVIAYSTGPITLREVNDVLGALESELIFQLADVLVRGDVGEAFAAVDRLLAQGKDIGQLLADLTIHLRNLLLATLSREDATLIEVTDSDRGRLMEQAGKARPEWAMKAIELLAGAQSEIRQGAQPRIAVELALARICRAHAGPEAREAVEALPARAAEPAGPAAAAARHPVAPAPAAATSAAGPGPPPSGELDLAHIRANWDAAQAGLSASIRALLRDGRPTALTDSTLTVRFQHEFHCTQVSDKYLADVEEALSKAFGHSLKLRCVVEEGQAASESAAPMAEQPSLLDAQGESDGAGAARSGSADGAAEDGRPAEVQDVLQLFDGSAEDE